jgi:hypothetical protein
MDNASISHNNNNNKDDDDDNKLPTSPAHLTDDGRDGFLFFQAIFFFPHV